MNRYWLITSTTYGTWLPGDERGFVSPIESETGERVLHNEVGAPYDRDMPELRNAARDRMKGEPVWFTAEHAAVVFDQIFETCRYRGWDMHAVSIMANHLHVVVEAAPEVQSTKILGDLKSYAARALNRRWAKPASGTWWTESGSRRPLNGEQALLNAVVYVVTRQHGPLITWCAPQYAQVIQDALSQDILSGGRKPPGDLPGQGNPQGANAPRSEVDEIQS